MTERGQNHNFNKDSQHKPARPATPCRYCPGCKTFTFSFFFKLPCVSKARRHPWSPWTPNLIRRGLGGLFQLHWLCPRPLCASFLSPWRPTSEKNSPDNCKHLLLFPPGANPRLILTLVFFKIKGLSVWHLCTSQKEAQRNCWLLKYLQLNEAHGVC